MKILSRDLICTKFLGATDFKGGRVVAYQGTHRVVTSWDYSCSVMENHARAALMLWRDHKDTAELGNARMEALLLPETCPYAYAFVAVEAVS